MRANCITAVAQVYGREPTAAEIRNIEVRLARSMRAEAAADPQAWLALPLADQLQAGAKRAAADIQGESTLKTRRKHQQIIATARLQRELSEFPGSRLTALDRMVAFHAGREGSVLSVESRARAIEADAMRQLLDTLEASNPKFFGLLENPEGVRALVRELHGQDSGNATAKAGAKVYHDVAEALRKRFNAAGGDVGRLEDWGMPHHHSQLRVAKAGKAAWVAETLPLLNRDRYVTETGARMSDAEVTEFLGEAWTTIATGGANKIVPGLPGGIGIHANRGNEARSIHFRDGDAYLDYQQQFGERTTYEVLIQHVSGVSKDIALVESFGPNPDATFRLVRDEALRAESLADPTKVGALEKQARFIGAMYDVTAGRFLPVANAGMARFFDGLRNMQTFSKLGSAVLSAFSDEGTMRVAAHVAGLPQMQLIRNQAATYNPVNAMEKRLAMRAGLALNTMAHSVNRFGNEGLGSGWSSKTAQVVLRASGLNAMTDARRRAYGVTMMSAIGHVTRQTSKVGDLDAYDHRMLRSKGITDTDFAVWKRAQVEDWGSGNDTMLTPEAIYRIPDADLADLRSNPRALKEQAATRLLGIVLEETDVAVIEPGVRERAALYANMQRGTLKGELVRTGLQFKTFPFSMIARQWVRAMAEPTMRGKASYLAALVASTTVMGTLAFQASQILQGKDPQDMDPRHMFGGGSGRTYLAGLLRGGALSIFGDFLFSDTTQHGQSALATLAGPGAGMAEDVLALTVGNIHEKARGEDTHFGAEIVRFTKSNIPAANLWYTRAALNHLVFHQLQEYLSPGYLKRMRRHARKEFGQEYFWDPGEPVPKRAPDLERALGEKQ